MRCTSQTGTSRGAVTLAVICSPVTVSKPASGGGDRRSDSRNATGRLVWSTDQVWLIARSPDGAESSSAVRAAPVAAAR